MHVIIFMTGTSPSFLNIEILCHDPEPRWLTQINDAGVWKPEAIVSNGRANWRHAAPTPATAGGRPFGGAQSADLVPDSEGGARGWARGYRLWPSSSTLSINFLIVALAIFMMVRWISKLKKKKAEAPAAPAETPADIKLLTDIRGSLAKR